MSAYLASGFLHLAMAFGIFWAAFSVDKCFLWLYSNDLTGALL